MSGFLSIQGLSKNFGGLRAVDAVSFEMEQNTIHSVIGPNGAGKTTLFNLIAGSIQSDCGSIHFLNNDITSLESYEIAYRGIFRTFQAVKLSERMSVIENVMLGMHTKTSSGFLGGMMVSPKSRNEEVYMREEALRALKDVGLEQFALEEAGSLPFGSQRMIELARALIARPSLLLLDEPASGLNMKETEELTAKISVLKNRGLSILLVEHDMSLVMGISDTITVLNFGKKIAEGKPCDIQKNEEVIRIYLEDDNA